MSPEVTDYFAALPAQRRERLLAIRAAWLSCFDDLDENCRYRMPTYGRAGNWASLGNQKHHISVYFCSEAIIAPVKANHPELSYGKGCIRIRDSKDVPLEAISDIFRHAMTMTDHG